MRKKAGKQEDDQQGTKNAEEEEGLGRKRLINGLNFDSIMADMKKQKVNGN